MSNSPFFLRAGIAALLLTVQAGATHAETLAAQPEVGKPVRVVSLSFKGASLETIAAIVDAEGAKGVDLIVLPEA
jgi:hypothetical protein